MILVTTAGQVGPGPHACSPSEENSRGSSAETAGPRTVGQVATDYAQTRS
jgi:hypothetical protein